MPCFAAGVGHSFNMGEKAHGAAAVLTVCREKTPDGETPKTRAELRFVHEKT